MNFVDLLTEEAHKIKEIETNTKHEFVAMMITHHNFSFEGASVLFQHLKQLHKDLGGSYSKFLEEFNYSEYDNTQQVLKDYINLYEKWIYLDADYTDIALDDLKDLTTVLEIPNTKRLVIFHKGLS